MLDKPNQVGIKHRTEDKTAQLCWDIKPQTEDINSPKILGPNLKQDIKAPKILRQKPRLEDIKKPKYSGTSAIETQQCWDKKPKNQGPVVIYIYIYIYYSAHSPLGLFSGRLHQVLCLLLT